MVNFWAVLSENEVDYIPFFFVGNLENLVFC